MSERDITVEKVEAAIRQVVAGHREVATMEPTPCDEARRDWRSKGTVCVCGRWVRWVTALARWEHAE